MIQSNTKGQKSLLTEPKRESHQLLLEKIWGEKDEEENSFAFNSIFHFIAARGSASHLVYEMLFIHWFTTWLEDFVNHMLTISNCAVLHSLTAGLKLTNGLDYKRRGMLLIGKLVGGCGTYLLLDIFEGVIQ